MYETLTTIDGNLIETGIVAAHCFNYIITFGVNRNVSNEEIHFPSTAQWIELILYALNWLKFRYTRQGEISGDCSLCLHVDVVLVHGIRD